MNPRHGVLRNRLGLTDGTVLAKAEHDIISWKEILFRQQAPPENFDLNYLKQTHEFLFEDIYAWAGEIRTIALSKANTMSAMPAFIQSEGKKFFGSLKKESNLRSLDAENFSKRAAHYLGEINMLHPFREGNGRTQRLFMEQLAKGAGYELDWSKVSRQEMTAASIEAGRSIPKLFEKLIQTNLTPLSSEHALSSHGNQEKQTATRKKLVAQQGELKKQR
ncbi:cell filamentation protein Fic [Oecophyllibacter saccharovorans]|uniref:Fic/DOC family protein n=1 Tax=Oecophyllibacter saccharovorans TaxID=2558360 RepID=UPI00114167C8|nr:Fic family protein [Oecophyllibacter saccharovorans]QDH14945.1 cell filamentation protein Fic [Oecophyllibacter saccharovorans]